MKKLFALFTFLLSLSVLYGEDIIFTHEVNANGGLRMRETPSINGKLITIIPNHEYLKVITELDKTITINNITGKWNKVIWNNKEGYVFSGFLLKKDAIKSIIPLTIPKRYSHLVPKGICGNIFITTTTNFYFQIIAGDADDIASQFEKNLKTHGTYHCEVFNNQKYLVFNICGYNFKYHYIDPIDKNYVLSDFEKKQYYDFYGNTSSSINISSKVLFLNSINYTSNKIPKCEVFDYDPQIYGMGGIYEHIPFEKSTISIISK